METDRLMGLSESDFEAEMLKPPHSKVNQAARVSAQDQKRFEGLSEEEKRRQLGYINVSDEDYHKTERERTLTLNSRKNWVTDLMAKRAKTPYPSH